MTVIDVFVRIFWSVIVTVLCLIPLWIYLAANWLFEPQGFWQQLAFTGLGVYFLGGIQFFLIILLIYLVVMIWVEGI